MAIDIKSTKIELIQWLTTLEDNSIIQKIMEIKNRESVDWRNHISKEENDSIEKGLSDANSGKLKPKSEAEKIYGKWL